MKVSWRTLGTVLLEDEVLDKAFSRAKKAADRVDDSDRVFRVRKQMTRMVQTAADIIATEFQELVAAWPSLDQSPVFDVAMIDACVGCDEYRKNLATLQWASKQVQRIASQNAKKIIRTGRTELMHDARREAYGRISSVMRQVGPSLTWLSEARETLKRLPRVDPISPMYRGVRCTKRGQVCVHLGAEHGKDGSESLPVHDEANPCGSFYSSTSSISDGGHAWIA